MHNNSVIGGQKGETADSVQNARSALLAYQKRGAELEQEARQLRVELYTLIVGDDGRGSSASAPVRDGADSDVELLEGEDEEIGTAATQQQEAEMDNSMDDDMGMDMDMDDFDDMM